MQFNLMPWRIWQAQRKKEIIFTPMYIYSYYSKCIYIWGLYFFNIKH